MILCAGAMLCTGPGRVIHCPFVQGADNSNDLKHLFNGEKNANGTLFIDCDNARFFAVGNLVKMAAIVYGVQAVIFYSMHAV